jgi:hypothetical protein
MTEGSSGGGSPPVIEKEANVNDCYILAVDAYLLASVNLAFC